MDELTIITVSTIFSFLVLVYLNWYRVLHTIESSIQSVKSVISYKIIQPIVSIRY